MLNIVIPMAGLGSRFARVGYSLPKPLIPIHGIPMVRLVIENIRPSCEHRFIFICQRSHLNEYGLQNNLKKWAPRCEIIALDGLTEGAACTVLSAASAIDSEAPLMIANSDQYVDINIDKYLEAMEKNLLDGLIMTMQANDPKWSFVAMNSEGLVQRVVEKEVISDQATVGIYNFRKGQDFVRAARSMIARDERVNNEFYVAPTYNELTAEPDARVGIYNIGSEGHGMYGLGTPPDLDAFLALSLAREATAKISL